MGCASSKQKRCRHCHAPYSPVPRSYSMHAHHPPQIEGDSYHTVALTSTTLGSLKISPARYYHKVAENGSQNGFRFSNAKVSDSDGFKFADGGDFSDEENKNKKKQFSMGLIEAKTWSDMIEQKLPKVVPKTPIRTPPGEPETINTWELMEGLEDISPFRSPNHFRSFSFDVNPEEVIVFTNQSDSNLDENGNASLKPLWLQMTEDDQLNVNCEFSDFDPEVIPTFRKSLQELSPDSPFYLRTVKDEEQKDVISKRKFSFDSSEEKKTISGEFMDYKIAKDKVIVYFTSLRGVRKTYEDCCHVRTILKSLGIRVDERDVSMHSGFKEELKELLGEKLNRGALPKVFVGTRYIGGAEEIQKLHEDGQLETMFDSCEKIDNVTRQDSTGICEACGDIRFVPCETCSGSCKVYYEVEDEEYEDTGLGECGFQRCPDCNENGLIRCPICCN